MLKTNSVHIILKQDKEKLIIIAKDEGIGFDMNKTNTSSQGLKNISQRICALNGQVKIDTMPNKGTTLSLKLPL